MQCDKGEKGLANDNDVDAIILRGSTTPCRFVDVDFYTGCFLQIRLQIMFDRTEGPRK